MVFNSARYIKLPMSNATIRSHTGKVVMRGQGAGGVLLKLGGGGNASSYSDIDDYISTCIDVCYGEYSIINPLHYEEEYYYSLVFLKDPFNIISQKLN